MLKKLFCYRKSNQGCTNFKYTFEERHFSPIILAILFSVFANQGCLLFLRKKGKKRGYYNFRRTYVTFNKLYLWLKIAAAQQLANTLAIWRKNDLKTNLVDSCFLRTNNTASKQGWKQQRPMGKQISIWHRYVWLLRGTWPTDFSPYSTVTRVWANWAPKASGSH